MTPRLNKRDAQIKELRHPSDANTGGNLTVRLGGYVPSATQIDAARSASFAMVLMFRAVPVASAAILSFERPIPAP